MEIRLFRMLSTDLTTVTRRLSEMLNQSLNYLEKISLYGKKRMKVPNNERFSE